MKLLRKRWKFTEVIFSTVYSFMHWVNIYSLTTIHQASYQGMKTGQHSKKTMSQRLATNFLRNKHFEKHINQHTHFYNLCHWTETENVNTIKIFLMKVDLFTNQQTFHSGGIFRFQEKIPFPREDISLLNLHVTPGLHLKTHLFVNWLPSFYQQVLLILFFFPWGILTGYLTVHIFVKVEATLLV